MRRSLLFIGILIFIFSFTKNVCAQGSQIVANGAITQPIVFPSTGCKYNWVTDRPDIGLTPSGTGNIAGFPAVNNGSSPVTATITATPVQTGGYAYIANSGPGTVTVIDVTTQQEVATVTVGDGPLNVSVSPDGSRVYISNSSSNSLSVIDAATNKVTATIPVAASPEGVCVSPDGTKVYLGDNTNLLVIDPKSNVITASIPIGQYPDVMAVSPDGDRLYVTNNYVDSVKVINTATNKVISEFKVGQFPNGIAISHDGKTLYVANTFDDNISVVSTADYSLITNITSNVGPWGMALSPDGSLLYVTNSGDNPTNPVGQGNVSVINTSDNTVKTTIPVGSYPIGISVTPDGSQIYVVNDFDNTAQIIDTKTYNTINRLIVGEFPNSYGNFISSSQCTGTTIKYTIIVNPTSNIITNPVTGSISACVGSASASPDIEQFTVSGNNISADVTATAPKDFEISLTAGSGYGNSLTIPQSAGVVKSTVIYVRSAATAAVGSISGNVTLVSTGTGDQTVAVTGTINAIVSPSISIVASSTNICTGTPVTFTATPVNGGNTPTYQWTVNGTNAGTNNTTFTGNTFANGDIIQCVLTSNAACVTPANATSNPITMNVATQSVTPSVSIVASTNGVCPGTAVTFTASPVNGGNTPAYQWVVNGSNAGTNSATFISSTLANADVVSCTLTSSASCATPLSINSNTVTMIVDQAPMVNAGGDKTITIGKSVLLNASATGSISDIMWTPATGLSDAKILQPVANPTSTTTYTLTIQSADGCVGVDSATVTILLPVVIPNSFTPNGDGINDTWNIKDLNLYVNCTVQIFNRYGQLLYNSVGYGIPWNGTYKGTALPNGTYYYVINLKNSTKLLYGFVAIIR